MNENGGRRGKKKRENFKKARKFPANTPHTTPHTGFGPRSVSAEVGLEKWAWPEGGPNQSGLKKKAKFGQDTPAEVLPSRKQAFSRGVVVVLPEVALEPSLLGLASLTVVGVRHSSPRWGFPFLLGVVLLRVGIGVVFSVWDLAFPLLGCEFLPSLLGVWWLAFRVWAFLSGVRGAPPLSIFGLACRCFLLVVVASSSVGVASPFGSGGGWPFHAVEEVRHAFFGLVFRPSFSKWFFFSTQVDESCLLNFLG